MRNMCHDYFEGYLGYESNTNLCYKSYNIYFCGMERVLASSCADMLAVSAFAPVVGFG
jgi:hypothetical protein